MFENIHLIAKKNNQISHPEKDWDTATDIKMIDFYNKIMEFSMSNQIFSFDYYFKKNDEIIYTFTVRN